jgi:adenosylhomocysteine nucleosidase
LIAVFGALNFEIRTMKKRMFIRKNTLLPQCNVFEGTYGSRELLLVLTGVGPRRASEATDFVLSNYPVSLVISTGFGGALNAKTRIGDMILYTALGCAEEPETGAAGQTLYTDTDLLSSALQGLQPSVPGLYAGKGVSSPAVCAKPEAKRLLGREFLADVVDMESYWIGRRAAARGLPFLTLRAISDTVEDDLTELDPFLDHNRLHPWKLIRNLTSHPHKLRLLTYYTRNANIAASRLAQALPALIMSIQTG